MSRWFEKFVTGGGCSKRVASDTARKRFSAVIAVMMAIAITCSVAVPGAYANPLEDLGNAISNGVNGITQQLFGISLLSDGEPELYSVEGANTVVDPDTTNVWSDIAASSKNTQNIGRIWTDKSVFDSDYTLSGSIGGETVSKGDSDFLVSLSALSSTSNLKTMVKTSVPLDIVLVLDTSGSMSGQKMTSLKNAANGFIDATADANEGLDQSDQSRISIVTFASGSNVRRQLNYVTDQNAQQYKSTIRELSANGATWAEAGLEAAQDQLNSHPRQDAQKVVIFFTDGQPNHGNGFDNEVAAEAVNTAHAMKQAGVTIYAVGVMNGADASVTDDDDFNEYMNGVSSNYPDATAEGDNGGWLGWGAYYDTTFGTRAEGDYYKASSNASDIENIFEELSDEIQQGTPSGSPIEEVTQEGAVNPGTLTFTDNLGSYMEVSGNTMTVVYGDQKFSSTEKTTEGNVDTYHFEGTVAGNAVYKEANLADLTVTVAHDNNLATGDVVTVQIPASLLPMRNYDVDTDAKTMSVTAAYPIRLFYGVSVKQGAKDAIKAGSGDVYDAIVDTNKTDDGKVAFYSNLYNSGDGDTTATFTPSDGNKFYYYTQDTNLYVDQNCTQRATAENINQYSTLYYSEPYWEITSGNSAQEVSQGIAIKRGDQDWSKKTTDRQGNYYIPAGTQRLDRPASLNTNKTPNETGTAATVLTPNWEGAGVAQHLGNNGKITFDLPGELEIKKGVDWGNASDDTKQNQNSFEFTVNFNDDETLEGNFTYDVYGSGEDSVSGGGVTDGGTITLKDGQRAVIKGLPSGTTFTVTETNANMNGFTTTDTVTADPNNDTTDGIANGTIVGGSQQSVSFQNNYKADEPVKLSTKTDLKVKKNLTGRDWRAGDEFSFQITQIDNGAPTVQMADPTKVTVTQLTDQKTANFGDITFSESGQYRFRVEELSDADQGITLIPGIDYSGAIYRVTVNVADAGQGKLEITSVLIEQMTNDDGGQGSGTVQGDTMAFENRYVSGQGSETLQGTKVYENETGSNPIDAGKFSFQLEALGGYETGTVEGEAQPDDYTIKADSDAMPKPAGMTGTTLETGNVGDVFQFPTIYFDGNDVGKTFEYRITELPHQYQGDTELGMTYDTSTSYVVKIVVTEQDDPDSEEPKVVISAEPNLQPSDIEFTNKYEPAAAKLEGGDAIHGTKTLEGRQMKEGETFYFQLSALNDNAKTVLASPETVTVTDQNSMDFAFSGMTFTKVGTYTFQVNEVADGKGTETTNADGMTFDTNIATVTVTVTDGNDSDDTADHGKLLASVSYSNDKHSVVTDHAQFTNVYKANMNYGAGGAGGIAVTKTIVDRTMDAGDYNFTLTGTGPDGELTEKFSNTASAANGTVTMKQLQSLTFDEQDAEKTFTFTVDEADPTDENRLAGVEYDQSQYRVEIAVHDNHDGTMYTETTVTKIKNADGTEASEVIVDKLNSSTAKGGVPTFGFTNTYKPTEASLDGDTALKVTKEVTGAASPDGVNYTFTLTAKDTVDGSIANIGGLSDGKLTVSTNGVINQDAIDNTNDDTQTVSFGRLTFSKPGTYTFTVQEDQPDVDDGWTFGTDEHTVTVVVSDLNENNEYDGALHIKSVTPEDPTVITNSYKADPVIVGGEGAQQQITVQKSVTGADSNAEFEFKIEPVFDDTHTEQWWRDRVKATDGFSPELAITGVTQAQAVTNSFSGIQFNAVGEYKFNVTEVGAADFNAGTDRKGWTYDEHTTVVTITVTDEGNDGQLDAAVSYDNTSATTTADQAVNNAAAFTNKYEAGSTTLTGSATTFNGSKTLKGRDWLNGETFGFTMKPVEQEGVDWSSVTYKADDNSEPVTVGENTATATENGEETVSFWFPGSYAFTKAGTYTFNVAETQHNGKVLPQDDANGMTYDRHTGVITVTVEDNGEGQLVPSVDQGSSALDFTNVYYNPDDAKSGSVTNPDGSTTDDASAATVGSVIEYKVDWVNTALDENGQPTSATVVVTDKLPEHTSLVEGSISEGGSYDAQTDTITWTFENQAAGASGTVSFKVTVDESALEGGTVSNKATIGENDPAVETNTVTTAIDSGSLEISKIVEVDDEQGTTVDADKLFEFTVKFGTAGENGVELTGSYPIQGALNAEGEVITGVKSGEQIYLHHGDTAKVTGLPNGAVYTVTEVEVADDGYTQTAPVDADGKAIAATGTIVKGEAPAKAAFVNEYSADPGTVEEGTESAFNLTKQFTGRDGNIWFDTDKFNFTLTPVDATDLEGNLVEGLTVPMPADSAEGIKKVTVGADKAGENGIAPIDFGAISYERTGIYTYTVIEENGGNTANGITYDGRTVNIKVTVTDNGTGGLVAAVEKTDEAVSATDETKAVSFKNTYSSTFDYGANGEGGIDITKMLMNRDMTEGQFTFTVTAADELAAEKIGGETVKLTSAAAAANTAASLTGNPFGNVTFDRADSGKTFTYTIEETGTAPAGYTYDSDVFTVKITPVDNGDGTMSVTTDVSGKGGYSQTVTSTVADPQKATVSFVNIYDAGDVTVGAEGDATIVANKTLKNDDIAQYDGKFTFKVTSGDTVVATGKNNADGSITFDTITYTSENLYAAAHGGSDEVGTASLVTEGDKDVYTFVYDVTEDTPTVGGVSYTSGNGSVTITVTDDRAGKLSIDVDYNSGADSLEFVNTYGTGEAAEVTLGGNKTLTGKDGAIAPELKDGMFEFTITGEDGAPMPETTTVGNEGSAINFGPIKYTMENVFGTDGADETTVTEEEAAEATDEVATESETTDEIVAGESAPAEDEGIELYTAGRTKVYTYTISETNAGKTIDGITYDGASKTVEVTVTDNGDGTISAAVTEVAEGTDENMDFTFDNTYAVEDEPSTPTGDGALTITKKLSGRDMKAGEFTFQLVNNANKDEVYTATNGADGKVSFDPITFTKAGEYTYTLTEVVPDGAKPVDGGYEKDGVFYPSVSYTVTATVTDNHDGTLTVVWSMADGAGKPATEAVFENTYAAAPTSAALEAAKALEGRAVQKDEFSFKLFDADGNVVDEATNDENGVISFESLTFEKAGTYTYTVSEVVPEEDQDPDTDGVQNGGITYDRTVYTVEIVVTDNGKGNLVVDSITYKIGDEVANALLFKNIYKTQPTDPTDPTDDESWLKVTKELANRDLKAGEFTFQMRYVSGGNADAVTPKSITTTNDANGNVVFNQEGNTGFVFSEEGEYTFIISEIEGDDANIDYDDTEYTVVAKVTKNAETGELEVVWQLLNAEGNVVEEDPSITFHNVYKEPVTPPTPVDPDPSDPSKPDTDVDKKLTGRDLVDGEFSFVITATGDNASHVSPKSLTGTNDASGNVTFGGKGFVFDKAGDYTFTVSEVLPADDDPDTEGVQHNGVTYDETTFTITAHVTKQGNKLMVTWENADAPMVFENEYEPSESVDITFGATKVLEGRDLAAGEFSFELRDQDGNVVATATNAADGSIVFTSPVTFTEPGEYTYTIVEVSGNVSGVTYDDAVHTAVVTVTDNGDGTLSATVTYDGSGKLPVFTNVFTPSEPGKPAEPEKPSKPGIPQTGDFSAAAIGGTGLAAVALIATGLYLRRRNSH